MRRPASIQPDLLALPKVFRWISGLSVVARPDLALRLLWLSKFPLVLPWQADAAAVYSFNTARVRPLDVFYPGCLAPRCEWAKFLALVVPLVIEATALAAAALLSARGGALQQRL